MVPKIAKIFAAYSDNKHRENQYHGANGNKKPGKENVKSDQERLKPIIYQETRKGIHIDTYA